MKDKKQHSMELIRIKKKDEIFCTYCKEQIQYKQYGGYQEGIGFMCSKCYLKNKK